MYTDILEKKNPYCYCFEREFYFKNMYFDVTKCTFQLVCTVFLVNNTRQYGRKHSKTEYLKY